MISTRRILSSRFCATIFWWLAMRMVIADHDAGTSTPSTRLSQIHVVTRHGSRKALPKEAHSLQEGEGRLTSYGKWQMYHLGQWLRQRYQYSGINVDNIMSSESVHFTSSALERTMVSASSLALGLLNVTNSNTLSVVLPPPVFTKELHNDVTIRAYDKCHQGLRLSELYTSNTWKTLESQHAELLQRLAQIPNFHSYVQNNKIPLQQLWNVYDAIFVAQTECNSTDECDDTSLQGLTNLLTKEEWDQVVKLAHQAERLKYTTTTSSSTVNKGLMVGGNLLWEILHHMEDDDNDDGDDEEDHTVHSPQLFVYSAHYPTLLGLLDLLGLNDKDHAIPPYASALILEFHQPVDDHDNDHRTLHDDHDHDHGQVDGHGHEHDGDHHHHPSRGWIRVIFKPGDQDDFGTPNQGMVLHDQICSASDNGAVDTLGCPMEEVERLAFGSDMETDAVLAQWCQVCGNDNADVCVRQQAKTCSQELTAMTGAAIGIAVAMGSLVVVLVWFFACFRKQRHGQDVAAMSDEVSKPETSSPETTIIA